MIEHHGAQGRGRREGLLRVVRVVQIPDVRVERHLGRHLLEPEHGVTDTDTEISRCLGVPVDLRDSSSYGIRVLEYHDSLCRDALAQELGLLSAEVFFEQIDLIVLSDCLLGTNG